MRIKKTKKSEKESYGVCGSRKIDKDFCEKPSNSDDKMKEFSCEK